MPGEIILQERITSPQQEVIVANEIMEKSWEYPDMRFSFEYDFKGGKNKYSGVIEDITLNHSDTELRFHLFRDILTHKLRLDEGHAKRIWGRQEIKYIKIEIHNVADA